MRQANSVKIAKIIAAAIILSTFMLGCFILATTYMQSHAVCDQIRSLEDALDKEMLLEIMSQVRGNFSVFLLFLSFSLSSLLIRLTLLHNYYKITFKLIVIMVMSIN